MNLPTAADIAQTASLIEQIVDQAVVRPTGSPGLTGISGFLFDIVGTEDLSLDSEITDHYVENNVAIEDHIALRPERITVRGYVGELTSQLQDGAKTAIQVLDKVATLATMAPQFAAQAEQLYQKIKSGGSSISEIINSATSVYDIFSQAVTTATRQQAAYNYFYAIWKARQLVTVETPWNVFTDMAIEAVRCHQDDTTKLVSEFSVTFKKVRKANIASSAFLVPGFFSGRVADMVSAVLAQGAVTGLPASANIVFAEGALSEELA